MSKEIETTLVDVEKLEKPLLILHPDPSIDYLKELAESIKAVGQMQEITVRKTAGNLQVVIGYCRTQAAKTFGIPQLRAKIIECTDAEAIMMSATENIHRLEQDPIQEAELFLSLMEKHRMTEQQIAEKMAKSYNYVRGRLDLLRLSPEVREVLQKKLLTIGAAVALTKITNPTDQKIVAADFIKNKPTVELANAQVKAFLEFRKMQPKEPVKDVMDKAREEPKGKCMICSNLVKYSKLRGLTMCDDCRNEVIYLREKDKRETERRLAEIELKHELTPKNFKEELPPQVTVTADATPPATPANSEKAESEDPAS